MERRIRSERSYAVTSLTPGGSPGSISWSFAFTRSITWSAFSPCRMTTMPETASPSPSRSATPRRISGPSTTLPTSDTRIGTPFWLRPARCLPMSSTDSRVAAPADHVLGAAELDQPPADVVVAGADRLHHLRDAGCCSVCSRFGSTLTWYWRTKPPRGATSATPGTALQVIAQIPVLDGAQFGQAVLAGRVDQRVLKDPADAGGVRPQFGLHALREAGQDAATGTRACASAPSRCPCLPRR